LGIPITKDQQQEERNPESAGELSKCRSFVSGEHGITGEERDATGQRRRSVGHRLARELAGGEPGGSEEGTGDGEFNALPWKYQAECCAEHPRKGRVEDKARFACSVVWTGRPVRIKKAVFPTCLRVEPRSEVKIKVVSARSFVD